MFTDPAIEVFDHVIIDKITGRVYIAAANRVYQLSPELDLQTDVIDGPVNNVNKVLLIDYSTPNLISCGSARKTCRIHRLHNISDTLEIDEVVVSSHAEASAVAFIGPGSLERSQVMYIGVTNTLHSEIPAVSTRSLNWNNLFETVTSKTRIYVGSLHREQYSIRYVYGFSSEGFNYFLTTQRKSTKSNELESKLVRVCQYDEDYYSYTEVPIRCAITSQPGRNYNWAQAAYVSKVGSKLAKNLNITTKDDVLFVVFSESANNSSALCIYTLKNIQRKFTENIQKCFKGIGQRGLDFITPNQPCLSTRLQIEKNFCGLDINTPLGGEDPIQIESGRQFQTEVTAITIGVANEFTIAFIGTVTGHLKKILVESNNLSSEYEDLVVNKGSRVNSDLHFDPNFDYLYVATQNTISKVKVHNCDAHRIYEECVTAVDPFCGWCSLENKCSSQNNCMSDDVKNWIRHKTINFSTQVTPEQIQVSVTQHLNLMVPNVPNTDGEFKCKFQILGKIIVTSAKKENNSVRCPTPSTELLPSIPKEQHFVNAKLSVSAEFESDLSSTGVTFYDCGTFSTCSKCVSSSFSCNWCVGRQRCFDNITDHCKSGDVISGISTAGPSYRSGPELCATVA
ncbi:hypothetical protein RN001_012640 [Aquatica leii]|uniref:Sema domain-containing protein n=1 Tax=Aquatica leii TaxID=1421715 RepID=A0AAN7P5N6_9COLE|nr:hypothetical protein RN001_012640 [Aquatica leii]